MQTISARRRQGIVHAPRYFPIILDLLVCNATELIVESSRLALLKRLRALATCYARPHTVGPWVLIIIHTQLEQQIGTILVSHLTGQGFQGVHLLRARSPENLEETAQATVELHRLYFPQIPDRKRHLHVLLMGSTK